MTRGALGSVSELASFAVITAIVSSRRRCLRLADTRTGVPAGIAFGLSYRRMRLLCPSRSRIALAADSGTRRNVDNEELLDPGIATPRLPAKKPRPAGHHRVGTASAVRLTERSKLAVNFIGSRRAPWILGQPVIAVVVRGHFFVLTAWWSRV